MQNQKYVEKDGKGLSMVIKVYIVAEKNGEGAAYVEDQMRKGSRQGVLMIIRKTAGVWYK